MKKSPDGTLDFELEMAIAKATGTKPRLLLHACCGPCAAGALSNIAENFDITLFYYNPNIMPKEEFIRREQALKAVISHFDGVKLIVPGQDESEYLEKVKGYESAKEGGERCSLCFDLRLQKTAEFFAEHKEDFEFFATTLTVSPMKNAALINSIGAKIANETGVTYLNSNFKKHDGYLKSINFCKQWDIYRQHYCGCTFAKID